MKLLDLFCGAGGAAMGYHRAGFDVVGVDIDPQPDYFVQGDALNVIAEMADQFDAVHASPPCQAYTTLSNRSRGDWPDLIGPFDPTRDLLEKTGRVWVIENVPGAVSQMRSPLTLHGGMFGLSVYRPRLFEANVVIPAPPPCGRPVNPIGVYGKPDGRRLWTRADGSEQRAWTWEDRGVLGMGHVKDKWRWHDVAEAIPAAYTEHVGLHLAAYIEVC